ncbi:hypothetical protein VIGAN_08036900, partial [Vigna angularis var. angularis]
DSAAHFVSTATPKFQCACNCDCPVQNVDVPCAWSPHYAPRCLDLENSFTTFSNKQGDEQTGKGRGRKIRTPHSIHENDDD